MDLFKVIKKGFNYTIEVTEETTLAEVMQRIEDGLLVSNTEIFGPYMAEYVSNPVKDSYYLKINVVDTTGMARVHCISILKIWNWITKDYEVYTNTVISKKVCASENYTEVHGSMGQKISNIAYLLDHSFVFKGDLEETEEEDTETNEEQDCDCPFCHVHVGQSAYTKSDDDGDDVIELTREEAMRLNREVLGNIFSFMNAEKKAPSFSMKSFFDQILKEREDKKQKDQKKEDEDLNKLYNNIEESLNDFKKTYKLDPVIVSNIETIMDYLKSIKKKED